MSPLGRRAGALAVAAGLLGARGARAGECLINGNPVNTDEMAYRLELGTYDHAIYNEPFSVVHLAQAGVFWDSCSPDCEPIVHFGGSQCGSLVEDPVDFYAMAAKQPPPHDDAAYSEVAAFLQEDGKWEVSALAYLSPLTANLTTNANYSFELGTRDVIDVTSVDASMHPLEIGLRARSHLAVRQCLGQVFQETPHHAMRFRVQERVLTPVYEDRMLVDTTYYDQFHSTGQTWTVEVKPDSTLYVDVFFASSTQIHMINQDAFFQDCPGAISQLDFFGLPGDGIQVFFTADPALALTPRSGIAYDPVPVPEPARAALVATVALAACARRRRVSGGTRRRGRRRRPQPSRAASRRSRRWIG